MTINDQTATPATPPLSVGLLIAMRDQAIKATQRAAALDKQLGELADQERALREQYSELQQQLAAVQTGRDEAAKDADGLWLIVENSRRAAGIAKLPPPGEAPRRPMPTVPPSASEPKPEPRLASEISGGYAALDPDVIAAADGSSDGGGAPFRGDNDGAQPDAE